MDKSSKSSQQNSIKSAQQHRASSMLGEKRRCHSAPDALPAKRRKTSEVSRKAISEDSLQTRKRRASVSQDEKEQEVFVVKRFKPSNDAACSVPSKAPQIRIWFCSSGGETSQGSSSSSNSELDARSTLQAKGVRVLDGEEMDALTCLEQKHLGAGGYGYCYKVFDPTTRNELVVKTIYTKLSDLLTEAINLQELQGEGVQRLFGVCVGTRQLVSYYAGDTAHHYFVERRTLADTVDVFLQLARTLQEILRKGFTHNDLKADNVCIAVTSRGPVTTVIDLGLASRVGSWGVWSRSYVPHEVFWVAPEIRHDTQPTSEASDVYSLAVMVHMVLGLEQGSSLPPAQAALASWVQDAQTPDPLGRPTLEALLEVLEVLLEEAKKDQPPPPPPPPKPPGQMFMRQIFVKRSRNDLSRASARERRSAGTECSDQTPTEEEDGDLP